MNQFFLHKEIIQLYHVDGAKRLFYGQLFFLAHNALSAFLREIGFSLTQCLNEKEFQFPIVHSEADYLVPFFLDDEVEIKLGIEKIGTTSFTIIYLFFRADQMIAKAKTVHVTISNRSEEKIEVPLSLKKRITNYQINEVVVN